jgi:hypothetical protein
LRIHALNFGCKITPKSPQSADAGKQFAPTGLSRFYASRAAIN